MGKSYKKSIRSAESKNKELNDLVLREEDAVFGRAMKKLGGPWFQINVPDEKNHIIDVKAKIVGNTVVRIQTGDIVVVGVNESAKETTYEILGSLDTKTVESLRTLGRIHTALFSDTDDLGDDILDRTEEAAEEDEEAIRRKNKANKPVKKDKILAAAAANGGDDDVNIDDI